MKTKYLYIVAFFLLGLSAPAPAQSESDQGAEGLQATLNELMDDAAESYESLKQKFDEETIRLMYLTSDIRMRMNAKFEEKRFDIPGLFYSWTSESSGSLYAKFDWQNMSESIRAKSSGSEKQVIVAYLGKKEGKNKAQDFTMYVDAQGYWYVPIEMEGNEVYVRVNLMDQMQNAVNTLALSIDAAIAAGATEVIDQLLAAMLTMDLGALGVGSLFPTFPDDILAALEDPNVDVAGELLSSMTPLLEAQLASQFAQISNLPPLIHFAFIISPTLARTQFNVSEATVNWRGQDNCTKMTVLSGNDAGYQAVFDRYGRLIHLRDTDGSTADYWYDRDVTVNIPAALSMDMGNFNISTK